MDSDYIIYSETEIDEMYQSVRYIYSLHTAHICGKIKRKKKRCKKIRPCVQKNISGLIYAIYIYTSCLWCFLPRERAFAIWSLLAPSTACVPLSKHALLSLSAYPRDYNNSCDSPISAIITCASHMFAYTSRVCSVCAPCEAEAGLRVYTYIYRALINIHRLDVYRVEKLSVISIYTETLFSFYCPSSFPPFYRIFFFWPPNLHAL